MQKPVVVYAASGYTGRLTCEALTRLGVPFIAAGRSRDKLDTVVAEMRARGADCEARAVAHAPKALCELLRGATVVVNTCGPFSLLGFDVVRAALEAGVHYLDSTGEQDFMFDVRRDFAERFAQRRLVLGLSTAFLWGPGAAAAEVCLETPGIDSLEVIYAPPSLQTVASLQSMFRSVRRGGEAIVDGSRVPLDTTRVHRVNVPGRGTVGALCVGAGEVTFLAGDARVRNCTTYFASDTLARAAGVFGAWSFLANRVLSGVVKGDVLDTWSDALVLKLKKDPPPEERAESRFVVDVVGTGGGKRARVRIEGDSPYIFTGFMGAMGAQEIVGGHAKRFGYVSLAQTLGARHVLWRMREVGAITTIEGDGAEPVRANARHEPVGIQPAP